MTYGSHYTVMKKETVDAAIGNADITVPQLFADLTLGGCGHTKEILSRSPHFHVIGFDQDLEAIKNSALIDERLHPVHSNFQFVSNKLETELSDLVKKFGGISGVIMDLGVSSHHLDQADRGFSFRADGPLDMRMDQTNDQMPTAADLLESLSEKELERIFSEYGEETLSKKIASIIVNERKKSPIVTTKQLEEILFLAYPPKWRHGRTHPATRVFQALRIAVNNELDILSDTITQLIPHLKIGGRVAVITFHSLEDRIIKHTMREIERVKGEASVLTKKPILPSEEEIIENSRSRSAKLRVLERISTNQGVGSERASWKAKKKYRQTDF